MNPQVMLQAMNEKEMINLITDLMKFREKHGKDEFKAVIKQMSALLDINSDISKEDLGKALRNNG